MTVSCGEEQLQNVGDLGVNSLLVSVCPGFNTFQSLKRGEEVKKRIIRERGSWKNLVLFFQSRMV